MSTVILTREYPEPAFCKKEILRYAGCKEAGKEITALLEACLQEVTGKLSYKVCYGEFPVTLQGELCDFGVFQMRSGHLAKNLSGVQTCILFAATIGIGIDRLIKKYGVISPSKALMFQTIGAERIEALCDAFCLDMEKEYGIKAKPRFSPGYGDLPLEYQREIFSVLNCERKIGLTLSDSLLMMPSKSVTAVMGLGNTEKENPGRCAGCTL